LTQPLPTSFGNRPAPLEHSASVPAAAAWLGGLGLVPFVALSIASVLFTGELRARSLFGLLAYGAVILSFLGGIHWGLAIAPAAARGDHSIDARHLGVSVVPSLAGWLALLLRDHGGVAILAAAFTASLFVDIMSTRQGQSPAWYPRLRVPLTVIVVASLLAAQLAA
jgi:hypothetical protein